MMSFNRGGSPSWWVSLIPFVVLLAALSIVIYVFGSDALSGASQVALMFAAGVTVVLAMVLYKIPWKTFEDAILDNITSPYIHQAIIVLNDYNPSMESKIIKGLYFAGEIIDCDAYTGGFNLQIAWATAYAAAMAACAGK